ncbi:MAG TPA: acyl carrier protein [Phycisphaerales bacterium]|nr:acyl carrier protein [Phycisphaerales bacterium]
MTEEDILSKLKTILEESLETSDLEIGRETVARNVDGWTSINHLEIIRKVEQGFGIKIALPELMRMKNIGDLIDVIARKV